MARYTFGLQAVQLQSELMRHLVCRSAPSLSGGGGVGSRSRPVSPLSSQRLPTRLRGRQRRPGPLADQLALLLRHRRVDPQHQIVRAGHVRGADRDAILQQLRQRVRPARDPIQPRCNQHRAQLPAAGQRCLKARPPVVLAGGDVGEFRHQRPALRSDEGANAGLLGLQAQPAVALLCSRDPDEPDRKTRRVRTEAHQTASAGAAATR